MKLKLAIETSAAVCSVAAMDASGRIASRHDPMQRGHAERVFGLIREVCDDLGSKPSDITQLIVAIGPGSFTGQRVAIATAQGLMIATGATAFAISSLHALMLTARAGSDPVLPDADTVIVMDAKRGDVYLQTFDRYGVALSEPSCVTVEDARAGMVACACSIDGPAAGLFESHADLVGRIVATGARVRVARADALLDAPQRLGLASVEKIRPLYIRAPDARPPRPVLPA